MIKIDETLEEVLLKPSHAYIYALVDPRDMMIRYIGVTTNPYARLRAHDSNNDIAMFRNKIDWGNELKSLGLSPRMFILERVTAKNALSWESDCIRDYQERGADLLNYDCSRRARNAERHKMRNMISYEETPEEESAMEEAMRQAADLVDVPIS